MIFPASAKVHPNQSAPSIHKTLKMQSDKVFGFWKSPIIENAGNVARSSDGDVGTGLGLAEGSPFQHVEEQEAGVVLRRPLRELRENEIERRNHMRPAPGRDGDKLF